MGFLQKLFGKKRPAAVEPGAAPPTAAVEPLVAGRMQVGWSTDIGQQRSLNEDAILIVQADHQGDQSPVPFGLFILADGMGGHKSGEVVSALAARTLARYAIQKVYLAMLANTEHGAGQPSLTEVLSEGVNLANATVAATVPGGGTTLLCALVLGSQAYISNVGDSRAYIISSAGIEQVTRDHSLVDRLVELGQLTPEEAAHHPQKNVLYRAVGQGGRLEVDTFVRTIAPGQRLLLCSDGLWGMVEQDEIISIVNETPSVQTACNTLVAAANRAGGRDNISAILVEYPPV